MLNLINEISVLCSKADQMVLECYPYMTTLYLGNARITGIHIVFEKYDVCIEQNFLLDLISYVVWNFSQKV